MKPSVLLAAAALAAAIGPALADEIEPSPLSIVQALMDAEREANLERALSLFSKDAIIVNVAGEKILSPQLPHFLELDMWLNESFELEQLTVELNRVIWTKPITAPFYEHIGVAPIRFVFSADVRSGKIKSIVAHVPPDEIVRIESACRQSTPEPRIYGNPCSTLTQWMKAESARATAGPATNGPARDCLEMRAE